jgi:glutaminase
MGNSVGAVADYISELAKVDADKFGFSIATNGAVYSVGHTELAFTIQSISKAFAYYFVLSMEEKRSLNVSALNRAAMLSCGMYDYSGDWTFDVGFPAKSCVSGGIVGVVNRQMGIAAYSSRVNAKGNSVRGTAAFRQLSEELGLHVFEWSNFGSQYLRASED